MNKTSKILRPKMSLEKSFLQLLILGLVCTTFHSCHNAWHYIPQSFDETDAPNSPDYGLTESWAALPSKADNADLIPADIFENAQSKAQADCFYIHPTGFLEKDEKWNANVTNSDINDWTDVWPLKHQATAFNGSCKIYAPRYRQAHMKSFFHLEEGGKEALALAYQDVARAFVYFINHYNNGRPFIIAGHSQGTAHAQLLIKQFIDGTDLQKRMVCAYLAGMPTKNDEFRNVKPCENDADCGCFNSWTTFDHDYYPKFYNEDYSKNAIINPINWSSEINKASDYEAHQGILVKQFKVKYTESLSGQSHGGMLWVSKPKVPFLKHFVWKNNWHKADYNLFWVNIRINVATRISSFLNERD